MQSILITAPAALITTSDAKSHLKVDGTAEDALIASYVASATDYVEQESTCSLGTQTWEVTLPCWQRTIYLPRKPVQSITYIKYYDSDGTQQTLSASAYRLIRSTRHTAFVEIKNDAELPGTEARSDAIVVRYVAGFSSVPTTALQAVRLALGLFHEDRIGEATDATARAVTRLCRLFRGY